MKITVHYWEDDDDRREELFIDGKRRQYVGSCEPEDAIIGRDLVSCFDIVDFMKEAHAAGAAGQPFEVTEVNKES